MLTIQVIPRSGLDVYKLVRDKVTHEAKTWKWANKAKTRLQHSRSKGYIKVSSADGILIAQIFPQSTKRLYFLAERFVGRLVAWFANDLVAINIQLIADERPKHRK